MGWKAQLTLRYSHTQGHTTAHDAHEGPLRVLQRLYPEGPAVCHHVIVHPPGGVVGGDELRVDATLGEGAHALITTPGATRFYRSEGEPALQQVRLSLAAGARLEWLPMETIAYSGCRATSRLRFELAPGAEAMGWDLLALGLPAAGQGFDAGWFEQHLEMPGHWLERGTARAGDRLLDSPLGWAGQGVLATMWWAAGEPLPTARREALLESARGCVADDPQLVARAGATAPQPRLIVLRVLAHRVEPALQLLMRVRAAWRREAWNLAAEPPRIWRT